jgi:hypothetical protein
MNKIFQRDAWQQFSKILCLFIVWKSIVFAFAFLAAQVLPLNKSFTTYPEFSAPHMPYLLGIWGGFDGYHYMTVAFRGYEMYTQAFFPLFPILIAVVGNTLHWPYIIAGQVVSNGSFLLSLFVMNALFKIDVGEKGKAREKREELFWVTILAFPTSLFLGAVYNDALFLLLACLTLYCGRRRWWVLSALFGALATLARLNGLALFWFIVVEYLVGDPSVKNKLRATHSAREHALILHESWQLPHIIAIAKMRLRPRPFVRSCSWLAGLIPLVFLGYLAYHNQRFHDWHVVFSNMSIWKQDKITLPPQVIWRYIRILIFAPKNRISYFVAVLEVSGVAFYIGLFWYAWKKIRPSYWVFFLLSIIIPWLTGTFQGMPRYGLHLYPLFLTLSLALQSESRRTQIAYLGVSFTLLFICIGLFTRGYFVA